MLCLYAIKYVSSLKTNERIELSHFEVHVCGLRDEKEKSPHTVLGDD